MNENWVISPDWVIIRAEMEGGGGGGGVRLPAPFAHATILIVCTLSPDRRPGEVSKGMGCAPPIWEVFV